MAIEGLTQQQSDFVERFLKVPKVFNRKAAKKRRRAAADQFRLFNAEEALIRDEISAITDPELRSVLLAQLRAAEVVIERDPKALDFSGGHAQLQDVHNAVQVHVLKAQARATHATLETTMAAQSGAVSGASGAADAQSDIALTWAFIEEKMASGTGTNNLKDIEDALKAMERLDGMLQTAAQADMNPFEARIDAAGDAKSTALAALKPEILTARRTLLDLFNQLVSLREKLDAQFGAEHVPLAIRMGCQATQKILDDAVDAAAGELPAMADEANDSFTVVHRDGIKVIADAQDWARDHAAFRVRYEVMQAHPARTDAMFVKPEFDKITAAYVTAKDKAGAHEYADASADITLVRHDLKDALDFADDFANYQGVFNERRALLATLPAVDTYPIPKLQEDHADAMALLEQAKTAFEAKQMSTALSVLNTIPSTVQDIIELNKFAANFALYETHWENRQTTLTGLEATVQAHISKEITYAAKAGKEAQDDAAAGAYKRAAGKLLGLLGYQSSLIDKGALIAAYLMEKTAFTARRRETRARKGAEGRVAIETYYQSLVGDEAKRASAEASGDFKLANAMAVRLKGEHAEMMKRADDAKDYLSKKKTFESELAKLSGAGSADATDAKATAEQMRANAIAATQRGNWFAAARLLESAILEIQRAVSDAETAALIDGMQGGGDTITLGSDAEFQTIYAAFAKVLEHVEKLDTEGTFAEDLLMAEANALSAEAEMAVDLSEAEARLNAAIAECKAIALRLTAARSFEAQEITTVAVIRAAENANTDGIADAEIEAANDALKAAQEAANAPAHDFAGAIRLLGDAQARAREAMDATALYVDTVKDARGKIQAAIAAYSDPQVAQYLSTEATRLHDILDEMNTAFDARNLSEVATTAAKGQELASFHVTQCDACKKAVAMYQHVIGLNGVEQNHAITGADLTDAKTQSDAALAALQKGNFRVAIQTTNSAYWLIIGAREKAVAFDLYLPSKLTCEQRLDALETRTVVEAGPGHDAVLALRERFDATVKKETQQNYSGARKLLEGFDAACDAATQQLDTYDLFALQKTRGQKVLETLQQRYAPAIATMLTRLEGKDRNADRLGQSFDFEIATTLYVELQSECANAHDTAEAIEEFADSTVVVKSIPEGDVAELNLAIGKARSTLRLLAKRPSAMYVHDEFLQCDAQLDRAEETVVDDFRRARRDLEEVADTCVQMTLLMAQYDQLNDTAATARALAKSQQSKGAHADFVRDELDTRVGSIEASMRSARQSKSYRAQTQMNLEETISDLRDLAKLIDAHGAYLNKRTPIEEELARLEKNDQRHLIREDLAAVRKLLTTAATKAADRNHPEAEAALKSATQQLDVARVRGSLATNTKPTAAELKSILDAPDGLDQLDSIVDGLEASVQREVMALAFEARFGCKLEMQKPGDAEGDDSLAEDQMQLPAANIRRFYKEMAKLPVSNTLDNDSMLSFSHVSGDQTGSAYDTREKKLLMREGDEASSRIYAISAKHEIGDQDDRALPKPGEERTAFSWNTLHEVGHAVDDKLGYMKKHGERLAGWKVYGGNVKEPATEIAGAYNFDADYVSEYMLSAPGAKLPIPDPVGCEADEWYRRMEECRMFVDRARNGNSPWSSASIADACSIGEFTYVESYKNDWSRYRTAERRLAVSGYQFRAPGEWFSELYAAMCSGRLNDSHPHRDEISKLCMKEDA